MSGMLPRAELHVGEAIIRLDSLHGRCHMTTVHPDTPHVDLDVLRDYRAAIRRRAGDHADHEAYRTHAKFAASLGSPVPLYRGTVG
jgi:hypothetical protein